MDITQFVMAYGVEQDRLSPPAADGGKRRRIPCRQVLGAYSVSFTRQD